MGFRDPFTDPQSQPRRPRRAAYALPTLFTAGNIFLGYLSILRSFRGAMMAATGSDIAAADHFAIAAKAIVAAVVLDGLDGRIARMTHTTSDFGREMDSLADVISFGIAPAVLAFAWGVQFVGASLAPTVRGQLFNTGYFVAFLFLLCGAVRLARFNVQKNPIPKNPGRPDRKYFVGLPIPAAAGMVAAVVYAFGAVPIGWWPPSVVWLALLARAEESTRQAAVQQLTVLVNLPITIDPKAEPATQAKARDELRTQIEKIVGEAAMPEDGPQRK